MDRRWLMPRENAPALRVLTAAMPVRVHDLIHTALRDAVGQGDAQQVGVGAAALVRGFGVQHRADGPQRGAMLGERPGHR